MTPEQRSKRGRLGAHTMHSLYDSRVVSAPGRTAAREKLYATLAAQVDPDGKLDPAERERRIEHARSAHFRRLGVLSGKARSKR